MTKARTHSRNAFPSPSSWKYVASLRKSTVMVRFVRVGLAAVPMCHPQVIRSRQRIRHDGGNPWKSQDHREGLRPLPLKSMECGNFRGLLAPFRGEPDIFRLAPRRATDFHQASCFEQTQAMADLAFGMGESLHELWVAA